MIIVTSYRISLTGHGSSHTLRLMLHRATASRIVAATASLVVAAVFGFIALRPSAATAAPTQVVNGDLSAVTGSVPNCFTQGGYGTHTATWALSTDAHTSPTAQAVTISGYVNGDRKLMPTESDACAPAVTPGNTYQLSVWYKSTGTKNSLTVFRHTASGWTYWTDLAAPAASATWQQVNVTTPAVPAGTDQITFGISLSGNGTLITDDYSLTPTTPTPPPPPPPPPSGGELTTNGNLEAGGNPPTGWANSGWGDAQVTAGVTTSGVHGGTRAYNITLAGRTQGDYKLLPTEAVSPKVTPGTKYNFSVWYKSTTASNSVTVFTHTAAGWGYWTDLQTLPATTTWTQAMAQTPAIPAGVDAIAWGVSIYGDGTLITDDYSTTTAAATPPPPPPPPPGAPAIDGQWSILNYQIPIRAIHSTLLKNGKVLLIAGSGNSTDNFAAGSFKSSVWDPGTGTFTTLNVPKDMFCAGHTTLADGRVLIQGGTKSYPTTAGGADYGGLRDSWIFNPDNNTFTATNLANEGHWYPTLTELGNGDIWMAGGLKEDTTGAVNTELFSNATKSWLPPAQVPQTYAFWGLYPHMFLLADGRLFYTGGHVFGDNIPGSGAAVYNYQTAAISPINGLRQKDMRDQSASVLLPPAQRQKFMITGGGNINTANPGIALTDLIDMTAATPSYTAGPDLPGLGKMYVNATILPDRNVLVSNGGRLNRDDGSNVLSAATYDTTTNTWKPVAADPIGRNYHSSAVLLPDGRVAVIGSNPGNGTFEMRISMYQPNYFFKTARPTLTGTPATATYGQNIRFNVGTATGKTVKWAQLTRPMSVTHQMDSNMRLVDLPVVVSAGVATATIPANRNILPPGPYMLTITDSDNIPSAARWVMVQ